MFSELIILFFSSIFLYISNLLMSLFLVHIYLFSYHVFQLTLPISNLLMLLFLVHIYILSYHVSQFSLTKRLVHLVKPFIFSKLGLTPRSDIYKPPHHMNGFLTQWDFDEPKNHLFLVHFSVLFLAIFE